MRGSTSTAVTDRTRAARAAVRTPGPGPTSSTSSSGESSAASTIAERTARSTRKRCPNDVAARTPCRRNMSRRARGSATFTRVEARPSPAYPLKRLAPREHPRRDVRRGDGVEHARPGVTRADAVRRPGARQELEEPGGAGGVVSARVETALAVGDPEELLGVRALRGGRVADDRLDLRRRGWGARADPAQLGHRRRELLRREQHPSGLAAIDQMDEIGVFDAPGLAGCHQDLVRPVQLRVRLEAHREGNVLLDGHLLIGDPGDSNDVARVEGGAERPVDLVERAEGYVGRREEG